MGILKALLAAQFLLLPEYLQYFIQQYNWSLFSVNKQVDKQEKYYNHLLCLTSSKKTLKLHP